MSDKKIELLKGEESLLLNHNYDGIQELDHPLPRWWLWILYGTIVFGAWYIGYYMSGPGPTPQQELKTAMAAIADLKYAAASANDHIQNEDLDAAFKDPQKLEAGKNVFTARCVVCHGNEGQGIIGPNLTDNYWIHGKGLLADIESVVKAGVLDKGMPPWVDVLSRDELVNVVAYTHSIQGTKPANPKPPQGEAVELKE